MDNNEIVCPNQKNMGKYWAGFNIVDLDEMTVPKGDLLHNFILNSNGSAIMYIINIGKFQSYYSLWKSCSRYYPKQEVADVGYMLDILLDLSHKKNPGNENIFEKKL
jgi:hypothetical protein